MKRALKFFLFVIMVVTFVGAVNALGNNENQITIDVMYGPYGSDYTFVSGDNINKEDLYFAYISNKNTGYPETLSADIINDKSRDDIGFIMEKELFGHKNFLMQGDTYVVIYEGLSESEFDMIDNGESLNKELSRISEPIKINDTKLLTAGERVDVIYFDDFIHIFLEGYMGSFEGNVNYKVDKIISESQTEKIENDESSVIEDVYQVAKQNLEPIIQGRALKDDYYWAIPTGQIIDNLEEGYYYLYVEIDSQNGKYISYDGISLFEIRNDEETKEISEIYFDDSDKYIQISLVTGLGDPDADEVRPGRVVGYLMEPERADGYDFAGWCTDQSCNNMIEPWMEATADIPRTLYAKWVKNNFNMNIVTSYRVRNNIFLVVPQNTKISNFDLSSGYSAVYEKHTDSNESRNIVATGDHIKITHDESSDTKTFSIIVFADANGDGVINSGDLYSIVAHLINRNKLRGALVEAADANHDDDINSGDLFKIQSFLIGKTTL